MQHACGTAGVIGCMSQHVVDTAPIENPSGSLHAAILRSQQDTMTVSGGAVLLSADTMTAPPDTVIGRGYDDSVRSHACSHTGRAAPAAPNTTSGVRSVARIHGLCVGGNQVRAMISTPVAVLADSDAFSRTGGEKGRFGGGGDLVAGEKPHHDVAVAGGPACASTPGGIRAGADDRGVTDAARDLAAVAVGGGARGDVA